MKPLDLLTWMVTIVVFLIGALITDGILTIRGKDRVSLTRKNNLKIK